MTIWPPRVLIRQTYARTMRYTTRKADASSFQRSAVVFSPHQDDETLGCGGTIIRRTDAGANIAIVFMTDGRQSHSHLVAPEELVAIRRHEARAAGRLLGVADDDLVFLNFADGQLENQYSPGIEKVLEVLRRYRPDDVFVPYRREPQIDHRATYHIVMAALKAWGQPVTMYEYPVWFWHHWPWIAIRQKIPPGTRFVIRNTLDSALGMRVFTDFHVAVHVDHQLTRKRAALNQHRSQMSQLIPDRGWLTLPDLAGGEFLACFFQPYEVFLCRNLPGKRRTDTLEEEPA